MSYETLLNAVRSRFATEFPLLPGRSGIPIAWENVKLNPEPDVSETWIHFDIEKVPTLHQIRTIKAPTAHYALTGIFRFDLFTPLGQGAGPLSKLADDVRKIYQGLEVESVTYTETRMEITGERRWYQGAVLVEATLHYFA